MHAVKTRLVLVWIPIGWERSASFVNQSQSAVMQNQSKQELLSYVHSIENRTIMEL